MLRALWTSRKRKKKTFFIGQQIPKSIYVHCLQSMYHVIFAEVVLIQ